MIVPRLPNNTSDDEFYITLTNPHVFALETSDDVVKYFVDFDGDRKRGYFADPHMKTHMSKRIYGLDGLTIYDTGNNIYKIDQITKALYDKLDSGFIKIFHGIKFEFKR